MNIFEEISMIISAVVFVYLCYLIIKIAIDDQRFYKNADPEIKKIIKRSYNKYWKEYILWPFF